MWPAGARRTPTPLIDCVSPYASGSKRAGALRPHARLHDLDGLARGEHGAVAGAGVIAMAVGDDGAIDRARRVDEEAARLAKEPAVGRIEPLVDAGGAHAHL